MSCVTLLPPASVALTDAARGTASAIQCAAIKMGREQRRKRLLPEGQRCYLCGDVIGSSEEWNRDHVPPRAIFASSVRKEHNPNLDSLVPHTGCNSSHQLDPRAGSTRWSLHACDSWAFSVDLSARR